METYKENKTVVILNNLIESIEAYHSNKRNEERLCDAIYDAIDFFGLDGYVITKDDMIPRSFAITKEVGAEKVIQQKKYPKVINYGASFTNAGLCCDKCGSVDDYDMSHISLLDSICGHGKRFVCAKCGNKVTQMFYYCNPDTYVPQYTNYKVEMPDLNDE